MKKKEDESLSLSVCGFKSIADKQTIEISPLTILAGANSSGKSSIIQPLLLMKQTLEAQYDPGVFLLDGPNVHFSMGEQMFWKGSDENRATEFTVEFGIGKKLIRMKYVNTEKGIDISEMAYETGDNETLVFSKGMTNEEKMKKIKDTFPSLFEKSNKSLILKPNPEVVGKRCFIYIQFQFIKDSKTIISVSPDNFLKNLLLNLIHLPGLRGNPERTYKKVASGKYFPGTFENYTASVIYKWKEDSPDKLKLLGKNLQKLGLTRSIDSREINDTQIGLYVDRLPVKSPRKGSSEMVSIADVGFGVSQSLPVVLALMVAEPGQMVYIEQPELHLHPRAQVAPGGIISEAAGRGFL